VYIDTLRDKNDSYLPASVINLAGPMSDSHVCTGISMTESATFTRLKAQVTDEDVVLDIGTKSGDKVKGVAGTVVGIDITDSQYRSDSGIAFILADGRRLPFAADSFDYVFCNQVLEHLPGHEQLIAEAARVMKPDGAAYFSFPNRFSLHQPHGEVPRYYSLLPRKLGLILAPHLLDADSVHYYRQSVHPLSPLSAGYHLRSHFDVVEFPMGLDPETVTASPVLQRALWWANTLAMYPPLKWGGELVWPHTTYLCAGPD